MDLRTHLTRFETEETTFMFYEGASDEQLSDLARQFQMTALPRGMAELYKQSNGISQLFRGIDIGYLTWPVKDIIKSNLLFRNNADFKELYMPFDQLLFFADAGNGDQFAIYTLADIRPDIFAWDHENDSRKWVAPDILRFTEWWLGGVIKL